MDDDRRANRTCLERLVMASQAGDRGAFDELVRLHQRRAMDVAVRMLGAAGEAAEAVQTGFVRAYLSIGKLRRPERFEVWLLRIIANAAVSQARSARRRARNIEIAPDYEDKKTPGPVQAGAARDLKEAVSRAMLKLSKKEAKAISLFGLQDLSHKEAAEIMDCSPEVVRWHVFKARQKLKVLLKDYL